jgi:DNA-binding winged helix-turn-helix (wHTH) protein
MRYFFEEYAFDTDRRELHRVTSPVLITPQVFDLLDYLIRHRDRVVSKDDLLGAVWNGRIVSDAALTTRLNAARVAIGDDGQNQRLIKTLPRKGFRFVGAVREEQTVTGMASSVAQSDNTTQKPLSPPRLSIVVTPFANLGGDPKQDYFVDGVTENLTTDLSRISHRSKFDQVRSVIGVHLWPRRPPIIRRLNEAGRTATSGPKYHVGDKTSAFSPFTSRAKSCGP